MSSALLLAVVLAAPPPAGPPVQEPPPRGNRSLTRQLRVPGVLTTASLRLGILAGGGLDFVQPIGFGFALAFRGNLLRAGPARFGLGVVAGYTRYGQRLTFADPADPSGIDQVFRTSVLSTFDFSGGGHVEIVAGPVIPMLDIGAGLAIGTYTRPRSAEVDDEQRLSSFDPMIRSALTLAIPIRNDHGIAIGGGIQKIFSRTTLPLDPEDDESARSVPFDLSFEITLAYQGWF